uniref:Uncharacterized protein n=1 Tax=Aegilops tauschii subsp. strangulata TaxID=200361 RepID=A0A453CM98_AEGTS
MGIFLQSAMSELLNLCSFLLLLGTTKALVLIFQVSDLQIACFFFQILEHVQMLLHWSWIHQQVRTKLEIYPGTPRPLVHSQRKMAGSFYLR